MYDWFIRLVLVSGFIELGLSLGDFAKCSRGQCPEKLQTAKNAILKIDWKPVSIFPEEAKRFRDAGKK